MIGSLEQLKARKEQYEAALILISQAPYEVDADGKPINIYDTLIHGIVSIADAALEPPTKPAK